MAEFETRELNELEDALESLAPGAEIVGFDQLSAPVRERLDAYRDVLALTDRALPSVEPDPSILASVMAEARAASVEIASPPAVSWWTRVRGSLVPALALAASTAVVLWIVRPRAEEPSAASELARAERGDVPGAVAAVESAPADAEAAEAAGGAAPAAEPIATATPGSSKTASRRAESPAEESPADSRKSADDDALGGAAAAKPSKSGPGEPAAAPAPEPAQAPATAPLPKDKDTLWAIIDDANARRLAGSCERAVALYREVIEGATDSLVLARAHAGVGLCLEFQGRPSEAKESFARARAAAAGVEAWIVDQRERMPLDAKQPPNAKSAAKKSKAGANSDDDARAQPQADRP